MTPRRLLSVLLGVAGTVGAVLVIAATFATVIEIEVLTTSEIAAPIDTQATGGERHGPALVLLGLAALVMLAGALVRDARPAALAVLAIGVAVLAIALVRDAPDLDETGEVGELYEQVTAGPQAGFYLETGGGVLLALAGGGLVALGSPRPSAAASLPPEDDRDAS